MDDCRYEVIKLTAYPDEHEKHPLEGKHSWLTRERQKEGEEVGEGGDDVEDKENGAH